MKTSFFSSATLILIFVGFCNRNTYAQYQTDATLNRDSLNAAKEIVVLKHRLEIRGMESAVIYTLAADYSLTNQLDASIHYLNIAADEGWIVTNALADLSFDQARNHPGWNAVKKCISDIWGAYYPMAIWTLR